MLMQEKYRVLFRMENGRELAADAGAGESLLEAAKKAGVALDAPCGGGGTCGKCRVALIEGAVSGGQSGAAGSAHGGLLLACTSYPQSDVAVLVEASGVYHSRIMVDKGCGRENAAFRELREALHSEGLRSGIELVTVDLNEPSIDDPAADRERLLRKLEAQAGMQAGDISLYALRKLPAALRQGASRNFSVHCVLRRKPEGFTVLDVCSVNENNAPVIAGLAVDIGTTTVAALLVDLASGAILASGSTGNMQIRYGADVINRIIESGKPSEEGSLGGLERLRRAVTDECINPLIASLCEISGIGSNSIYRAAAAANTTMAHFFTGVDPANLRLEPYIPAFFECGPLRGTDLGLRLHPEAEAVLAPAVGSYVGGDITAGVFASALFRQQELSLLIDLGTNGELVLGNAEFMVSCACSAGPAFEGGDISCGMRAREGAVEACCIGPDMEPALTVIGAPGQKPLGLCGSGLIDIAGELFQRGIINARGKLVKEGRRIRRDAWGCGSYIIAFPEESADGREISLSETDIDNFIRAKGAIFSAIRTMLAMLDLEVGAIGKVYIAGGIGGGINVRQAMRIGMLPAIPADRYRYIGNSSLNGAYAMLVSEQAAETVSGIGRNITYIELSAHPGYMEELIAACFLPHTNGGLF